ncbi:uncharacterized protein LOC129765813 [Toxorhynchites rutilus septentrionalis]|uniref:uncharacterized protein LOC129765813 n=1 Tax=Toxorhynchites rutilus septentrionalis TaxID=329112 RepID=UPI00247AE2EF|nr:uncharacterized protein LOC129765813 [Toxorhynchites rutilus septentrionalis]
MEDLNSPRNCQSCARKDSAEAEMVQCDACKLWEHFSCAGVDDHIKQSSASYFCKGCDKQGTSGDDHLQVPVTDHHPAKGSKTGPKTSSRKGSKHRAKCIDPTGSVSSSVRMTVLTEQLKLNEEERVMKEQELKEQEEMNKRMMEEKERQLEEKRKLAEETKLLRERKLKEDLELKQKQQRARRESLEKRQEIIREIAEASSRGGYVVNSEQKVKNWLEGQDTGRSEGNRVGRINDPNLNRIPDDPAELEPLSQPPALQMSPAPVLLNSSVSVIPPSTPAHTFSTQTLSQAQIAARQVLGKDLPNFSGNPEDWPVFISNYEQSTATCGYSDAENLVRLQRCLKGNALDSVRSRLLLPASVPHVVQTLRILFGRPDLIIRSLINRIHQLPPPKYERLETLMHFGLAVQNLVDHLKAAGQHNHLSNPVLLQELVEKLPGSLRLDWAIYKNQHQPTTLGVFGDFMSGLVTAASEVSFTHPEPSTLQKFALQSDIRANRQKSGKTGILQAHSTAQAEGAASNSASTEPKPYKQCLSCGRAGHRVAECEQFSDASIDERWKLVQQKGLCRTCLNSHGKWPCRSWHGCGIPECRQRHHTLLHSSTTHERVNISSSHVTSGNLQWPLFRILPVTLYGPNTSQTIYAFIDEGSSYTLLDESVADRLNVSGKLEPLTLKWTGNVTRVEPKSRCVCLSISGKNNKSRYTLSQTRTVSRLELPTQSLKYEDLANRYPHLRELPIEAYELVCPQILIGLDNLRLCVPLKLREGGLRDPIGAKCRLGWSIYGCVPNSPNQSAILGLHIGAVSDSNRELNEQLRDYFTLEDIGVVGLREPLESTDEKRARQLLEETTRRTPSGLSFETGLLWKTDSTSFPDSYPMAVRRLESLERRLQREPELKNRVQEIITEYERKGYIHKASLTELTSVEPNRVWYLPLGVVINPKKPAKIRLIWDAAAKVGDVSLNCKLLKGPDLLIPLPKVLSQFRQYPVAVCGDLMEMFHQFKIRHPDCQSQRFLSRKRPTDPPQVYVMDVGTFGSTCSPASAQYIINLNAKESAEEYPRAAAAIIDRHYVDDYLDSFETIQEAIDVVNEVKLVHSKGGFTLRRFLSNEIKVLQGIGEIAEEEFKSLDLERGEKTESVLGMKWIPRDDLFVYTFGDREDLQQILRQDHVPSKREVARLVMSLFDPLGFIAFYLVIGKMLIQELWSKGTGWDQRIPQYINERWRLWADQLHNLDSIRIPRCYFSSSLQNGFEHLQIHLFVDASETAYACVVYFRLKTATGVQIALAGAKTKVAPLKALSIPRLELKAAVLGARLMETIQAYHTFPFERRFCWSDANTVLAWIHSTDHRRYHKFVAIRVGELLTTTLQSEWRWVPSKMNTADIATKWHHGSQLTMAKAWFQGPSFLYEPEERWPNKKTNPSTEEELRHPHNHLTHFITKITFDKFNLWTKLQRVTAYVLRYIDNLRKRKNGENLELSNLTSDELRRAEETLVKTAQGEFYADEINTLYKTRGSPNERHPTVNKSSTIYTRSPFMDEKGVIRCRGRIGAAPYAPMEAKFPIILPRQHQITFLIVDWTTAAFATPIERPFSTRFVNVSR